MEISSLKIKKFPEETLQAQKIKKAILKKYLIFSQEKLFLYFGKLNFKARILRNCYKYFQNIFSYISRDDL